MGGYVEGIPLDQQCWHHGPEPVPAQYYKICVECGHCYVTADELEVAHRAADAQFRATPWYAYAVAAGLASNDPPPALAASEIFSCPLCTHDF